VVVVAGTPIITLVFLAVQVAAGLQLMGLVVLQHSQRRHLMDQVIPVVLVPRGEVQVAAGAVLALKALMGLILVRQIVLTVVLGICG
jgi:hypothetical protein